MRGPCARPLSLLRRRVVATLVVATLAVTTALPAVTAHAQSDGPDLNDLALDWARGRYLSPVICATGDELVRGGRRVLIAPGPRHAVPPVVRVAFSDLEANGASRCFNDLGVDEPNVVGSVQLRLHGRSQPDTATRDFKAALRRHGGFDFHIPAGRLRINAVGGDEAERDVDFRGGTARFVQVERGSDEFRLLAGLSGLRRMLLELEARDGTRLRFLLLMKDVR